MTDKEFLAELENSKPKLMGIAMRLLWGQRENAEDLVQVVMMKAYSGRALFKDGSSFKNWTITILMNSFFDEYRRKKSRVLESELTDGRHPVHKDVSNIDYKILWGKIDDLRLEHKHIDMTVMWLKGKKYEEIAKDLDIPIGTVKGSVHKGRKKLIERLAKEGYLDN
jgi:RNA polymerase sigma-70 factor (ECF subfamily)